MKTLSFLLFVVILIFAGCSKNDDILLETNDDLQLKSAEKGAGYNEQFYFYPGPVYDDEGNLLGNDYWLPVICDGVQYNKRFFLFFSFRKIHGSHSQVRIMAPFCIVFSGSKQFFGFCRESFLQLSVANFTV